MRSVRVTSDLGECRTLWQAMMPVRLVSDLWEVRACFQKTYNWKLCFVICEEDGLPVGLLPLNYNRETGSYHFFPGESWHGKTWLEQNRIPAVDAEAIRLMFGAVPGSFSVRYLRPDSFAGYPTTTVDEIGYLFFPDKYAYDIDNYFSTFSGKSAKKLRKELAHWEERGVEFRFNTDSDFDRMIDLNISRYGHDSYFSDARFADGFRNLANLLRERGWLRITTVLVEGEVAAIDMGCLYNGDYTLVAGGTNASFPGIAKLINLHHMKYACEQKFESVDFLCGDFNWKSNFHLTPRPLYQISSDITTVPLSAAGFNAHVAGAASVS